MIPKFRAIVRKGRLISMEHEKVLRYLQSFPDDTYVDYIIKRVEPTKSDPLRKYYFKWVMGPIEDYTGASKKAIHDEMKSRYVSEVDEFGIKHIKSVWSDQSEMSIKDKKSFILDVRNWAMDFLGVMTPEFEPKAHVE